MASASGSSVILTSFVRKLHGGSQPILARASNNKLYVIKFARNPQGPNLCFNEAMGTELYRACNLPVAEWKPVWVSDSFLDQNRICWIETPYGCERPPAGFCFGSRFLSSNGVETLEFLPGNSFARIEHLENFWTAWLIDLCANHMDNRQAIFQKTSNQTIMATFIDHGYMFGGPNGNQKALLRSACYLDFRVYSPMLRNICVNLCNFVTKVNLEYLWHFADDLPVEWKTDSALNNFQMCLDRLRNKKIVKEILNQMVNEYQQNRQRDKAKEQPKRRFDKSLLRSGICTVSDKRSAAA